MKKNKKAKDMQTKAVKEKQKRTDVKSHRYPLRAIPFFVLGTLCLLYYFTICALAGSYRSLTWIWIVGMFFFAGLGVLFLFFGGLPWRNPFCMTALVIFALLLVVFIVVEILIIANALMPPPDDAECIIVLGAAVRGERPSKVLYRRIEAAYEYLESHPNTVAVLSGGQGQGEDISEAECMRRELVALGIDESRLILEDKSTSTSENLQYSLDIIEGRYKSIAVVTNNFHVFRAKMLLSACYDGEVHAISAPFFDPLLFHYAVREFAGICNDAVMGNLTR